MTSSLPLCASSISKHCVVRFEALGLVNEEGRVLHTAVQDITVYNPEPDHYLQSSTQIWNAVVTTIKKVCLEFLDNCSLTYSAKELDLELCKKRNQ